MQKYNKQKRKLCEKYEWTCKIEALKFRKTDRYVDRKTDTLRDR